MGEEVAPRQFTREDRQRYRTKVHRCLDAFAVMLARSGSTGDARRLVFASLVYLPVLLAVMALDKVGS